MFDNFYLAWKYISFNKKRTLTLIACVTLVAVLPMLLSLLLNESERQLLSRAKSTPLLLGSRGSALDLVMNSIYFDDEIPGLIDMRAVDEIEVSALATSIPLYIKFKARDFPIVGTTLDYFDFRKLNIATGRQLAWLGECIIGAEVAEQLGLKPGDSLLSSPESMFDLAGVYPLKMKVVGVLARSYSADDYAVLVDVKTTWVIQGLVHGHEQVSLIKDDSVIAKRTDENVIANAKLIKYNEITPENIDSFHFHGNPADYPITAVLVLPNDLRSETILRGRYIDSTLPYQMIKPDKVIDELMNTLFRIKKLLNTVNLVVGIATLLALCLVFALSLRIREREIRIICHIGGSRMTIVRLLAAEVVIIVLVSGLICVLALGVVDQFSKNLVRILFIT